MCQQLDCRHGTQPRVAGWMIQVCCVCWVGLGGRWPGTGSGFGRRESRGKHTGFSCTCAHVLYKTAKLNRHTAPLLCDRATSCLLPPWAGAHASVSLTGEDADRHALSPALARGSRCSLDRPAAAAAPARCHARCRSGSGPVLPEPAARPPAAGRGAALAAGLLPCCCAQQLLQRLGIQATCTLLVGVLCAHSSQAQ